MGISKFVRFSSVIPTKSFFLALITAASLKLTLFMKNTHILLYKCHIECFLLKIFFAKKRYILCLIDIPQINDTKSKILGSKPI